MPSGSYWPRSSRTFAGCLDYELRQFSTRTHGGFSQGHDLLLQKSRSRWAWPPFLGPAGGDYAVPRAGDAEDGQAQRHRGEVPRLAFDTPTVICSDKTGTLTTNQMTVVACARPSSTSSLEEFGDGDVLRAHGDVEAGDADLSKLQEVCALCNQASIHYDEEEQQYKESRTHRGRLRLCGEGRRRAADDPVERASKANDAIEATYRAARRARVR